MLQHVIKILFLDHHTQPHKNLIFRPTAADFRTSVDRPKGGSRPTCTNVHSFELSVDRKSTDLAILVFRSTGSRPELDRPNLELTALYRSTGSRPEVDRPNLEVTALYRSTGRRPLVGDCPVSVDRPLNPVDRCAQTCTVLSCRSTGSRPTWQP